MLALLCHVADRLRTQVASVDGILQNPTGWHDGKRVWGGGIVPVRKASRWLPWPIDELEQRMSESMTATLREEAGAAVQHSLGAAGERLQDSEPDDEIVQPRQPQPAPSVAGLTAVARRVAVGTNGQPLGNVHTGAAPPWLAGAQGPAAVPAAASDPADAPPAAETDTMATSASDALLRPAGVGPLTQEQAQRVERAQRRNRRVFPKKHRMPAAAVVGGVQGVGTVAPPTAWLPKFGRVWEFGSREEARQEFLRGESASQRGRAAKRRSELAERDEGL